MNTHVNIVTQCNDIVIVHYLIGLTIMLYYVIFYSRVWTKFSSVGLSFVKCHWRKNNYLCFLTGINKLPRTEKYHVALIFATAATTANATTTADDEHHHHHHRHI